MFGPSERHLQGEEWVGSFLVSNSQVPTACFRKMTHLEVREVELYQASYQASRRSFRGIWDLLRPNEWIWDRVRVAPQRRVLHPGETSSSKKDEFFRRVLHGETSSSKDEFFRRVLQKTSSSDEFFTP